MLSQIYVLLILLCVTIVVTVIPIPTANTIINLTKNDCEYSHIITVTRQLHGFPFENHVSRKFNSIIK
jgi:hypothetical protein